MPDLVPLSGSERSELPGATPAPSPLDESQQITVTVLLRRRAEVPSALVEGPQTISTSELGEQYGAARADAQLVAQVLGGYGLTVTETHLGSRRLKVTGTIAAMQSAFGTTLTAVTCAPGRVGRRGATVPDRLPLGAGPAVRHHHRRARPRDRPPARPQFAAARRRAPGRRQNRRTETSRPRGKRGSADRPAGGELLPVPGRHRRYRADRRDHRARRRLHAGRPEHILLRSRAFRSAGDRRRGGRRVQLPRRGADGEVELDIEVVGGVAPGAAQKVYFAANTDQGFINAISRRCTPRRRRSRCRSAGASRRTSGPPSRGSRWTRRSPTRRRSASP